MVEQNQEEIIPQDAHEQQVAEMNDTVKDFLARLEAAKALDSFDTDHSKAAAVSVPES